MGAELIVAILVGPDKFDPAKVKEAKEQAKQTVKEAKRIWRKLGDDDFDMSMGEVLVSPIRFMLDHEGHSSLREAEVAIENLSFLKPAQFVNEFIQWWRSCSGRDTCGRSLPPSLSKKDWKIVVCGETTGGGSPDGEGWGNVRTAEWLGILDILGIK
jgi:hypothetical protein